MSEQTLRQRLQEILADGDLMLDGEARADYSHDIAGGGAVAAAVARPRSTEELAQAVAAAAQLGFALVPRGSGHSYSGGVVPAHSRSLIVDLSGLDRVIEIDAVNRFVRVQAGCTWATLLDALAPHGLRTPFFGPLSGLRATIGGALSQGATFFGSAMHGFSERSVIGLSIVLADGRILQTGTGRDGRPHPHPGGPDMGALFLGDCGAFGIKAEAVLRLIKQPEAVGFASFAFTDVPATLRTQVALTGSAGIAECFGFDRQAHRNLVSGGFDVLEGAEIAMDVVRQPGSAAARLGRLARLFRDGRRGLAELHCSLHLCVEGESQEHVSSRIAEAAAVALAEGGESVPDTIPRVTRSRPFRPIKALLGPAGERWLPVHGIFRLSDVAAAYENLAAVLAGHEAALSAHGMNVSLLSVSSGDAIVLEPQLFWPDALNRFHRGHVTPAQLRRYGAEKERPEARAFAHSLRAELAAAMRGAGAEHLQIGRYYPYEQEMDPLRRNLMRAFKAILDPKGAMAPGVLFADD